MTKNRIPMHIFHSLLCVLCFALLGQANAALPSLRQMADNRYVAQSFICYGTTFSEVPRMSTLPPQLLKSLSGVSDKGGEFSAGDVGGGPHERFITGAISQDVVVMAVEHGGIGYNVQLWSFLKNGANWDAGPASYYGFSASIEFEPFLAGVGQAFGCKNKIGTGAIRNDADIANAMRHDAEIGDAVAQFGLGHLVSIGRGVAKDGTEAEKWFRKAATADVGIQYRVGYMYLYGIELPRNFPEAQKYLRMVANQTDEQLAYLAYFQLGLTYENGWGVPLNKVAAAALFGLVPDYGDPVQRAHIDKAKAGLGAAEAKNAEELQSSMFLARGSEGGVTEPLDYFVSHGHAKLSLGGD